MERNEIQSQLTTIFRDFFDLETIVLRDETKAADIEEWDSMNHIRLISTIERKFAVRFATHEIVALQNVGEMIDLIKSKV